MSTTLRESSSSKPALWRGESLHSLRGARDRVVTRTEATRATVWAASYDPFGQRPPRPWAGRFAPPGRALACVDLAAMVFATPFRRVGRNAVRFGVPPKEAIPFPGSGRVSRQAGGRIAVSAPCQCRAITSAV